MIQNINYFNSFNSQIFTNLGINYIKKILAFFSTIYPKKEIHPYHFSLLKRYEFPEENYHFSLFKRYKVPEENYNFPLLKRYEVPEEKIYGYLNDKEKMFDTILEPYRKINNRVIIVEYWTSELQSQKFFGILSSEYFNSYKSVSFEVDGKGEISYKKPAESPRYSFMKSIEIFELKFN